MLQRAQLKRKRGIYLYFYFNTEKKNKKKLDLRTHYCHPTGNASPTATLIVRGPTGATSNELRSWMQKAHGLYIPQIVLRNCHVKRRVVLDRIQPVPAHTCKSATNRVTESLKIIKNPLTQIVKLHTSAGEFMA